MSDFHLIPMNPPLRVAGEASATSVGTFEGRVIALAVRGFDPIATPDPNSDGPDQTEGLLGWGTTYLLVVDEQRAAPFWVSKEELSAHWIEAGPDEAGRDVPPPAPDKAS